MKHFSKTQFSTTINTMSNTTSTKEKVVVGGALAGGLIFFGFLTNTCQNPLDHFRNTKAAAPAVAVVNDGGDYEARITELEERIQVLKDNSADEKTIGDLEARLSNQKAMAASAKESYETNVSGLEARIKDLSSSAPVEASPVMADTSVSGDVAALTAKVKGLSVDLDSSKKSNLDLTEKLKAMAMAGGASTGSAEDAAKLAEKVKNLNADNKKLANQLSKKNAEMKEFKAAMKDGDKMATKMDELNDSVKTYEAQITKKNGQIADLSAHINKLKAAKNVFVDSADDLPQAAKALLADLNTLEGKSEAEVEAAYGQYVNKHGATAKKRIKFSSGSSSLSDADKKEIALLTQAAGKNTYFFIVGYADEKGSAASNKKLSSARSTSVAKELGISAKGFQSAQAVYLGQTGRFGPSAENRVVEIWEIK